MSLGGAKAKCLTSIRNTANLLTYSTHLGEIEHARKNNPLLVVRRAFPGMAWLSDFYFWEGSRRTRIYIKRRPSRIQGITYGSKIADSFVV